MLSSWPTESPPPKTQSESEAVAGRGVKLVGDRPMTRLAPESNPDDLRRRGIDSRPSPPARRSSPPSAAAAGSCTGAGSDVTPARRSCARPMWCRRVPHVLVEDTAGPSSGVTRGQVELEHCVSSSAQHPTITTAAATVLATMIRWRLTARSLRTPPPASITEGPSVPRIRQNVYGYVASCLRRCLRSGTGARWCPPRRRSSPQYTRAGQRTER